MIDATALEHLKKLARLELGPEETTQMGAEINKVLEYFEQLSAVNTDGIEEMARPIALENVFRPDVVEPSLTFTHEQAMSQAVQQEEGFFKVPRVIE